MQAPCPEHPPRFVSPDLWDTCPKLQPTPPTARGPCWLCHAKVVFDRIRGFGGHGNSNGAEVADPDAADGAEADPDGRGSADDDGAGECEEERSEREADEDDADPDGADALGLKYALTYLFLLICCLFFRFRVVRSRSDLSLVIVFPVSVRFRFASGCFGSVSPCGIVSAPSWSASVARGPCAPCPPWPRVPRSPLSSGFPARAVSLNPFQSWFWFLVVSQTHVKAGSGSGR